MNRLLFALPVAFALSLRGQNCVPPENLRSRNPSNLFTDAREVDLGDAVAEQLGSKIRVLEAPSEVEFLDAVGKQLLKSIPASQLQFRFFLIDLPTSNAFALPGGRIYVSRKLISSVSDEDEVAGVLAHEMGHILAHQGALAMSVQLRRILRVTAISSREDVFRQYLLLQEAYAHSSASARASDPGDSDQSAADEIAVYLLTSAGFDPAALPHVLDRISGTAGQTGNFLTDLFGITKPEGKRLRDLIKTAARVPAGCAGAHPVLPPANFKQWRDHVANLIATTSRGNLPGLTATRDLSPALVAPMSRVRFSPDGKFALAQDEVTIHVLSIAPFQLLFDIPIAGALPAEFSPDSRRVVFVSASLRVEQWDVASHTQISSREIRWAEPCIAYRVSPDGNYFGCFSPGSKFTLLRVDSGDVVFQKNLDASAANEIASWLLNQIPPAIDFSPDGTWLAVSRPGFPEETSLYNLQEKGFHKLPANTRAAMANGFLFIDGDKILCRGLLNQPGALIQLPSGDVTGRLVIPPGPLDRTSNPNFVLDRPPGKYAAIIIDLAKKNVVGGSATAALDFRGDMRLQEGVAGTLVLMEGKTQIDSLHFRQAAIGTRTRTAFSPDLKWLAASNSGRSMVWNLESGSGAPSWPFEHADFAAPSDLQIVAAPQSATVRKLLDLDLNRMAIAHETELPEPKSPPDVFWTGPFRVLLQKADSGKQTTLTVQKGAVPQNLWSESYETWPILGNSFDKDVLVLSWPVASKTAGRLLHDHSDLKNAQPHSASGAHLVQVRQASTGILVGQAIVDAFSAREDLVSIDRHLIEPSLFSIAGKCLIVSASENRLVIEDWSNGTIIARLFGRPLAFNALRNQLLIHNFERELKVIDLSNGAVSAEFTFPERVVSGGFRADGQQLAALTADQKVYFLNLP